MYEWFDRNKIMQDVDAYQVALSIGMETHKKGKYIFIRCPGHAKRLGHEDMHMKNAYLTPKGYHCCACGETVDVITMVMEYLNCNYGEALEKIADINGNREFYYDDEKMAEILCSSQPQTERKQTLKHPPMISHEEQTLIGLTPQYEKTKVPVSFKDYPKEGYEKYDIKGKTGYLKYACEPDNRISLSTLYKEDYDSYRYLVVNKCFEAIDAYDNVLYALPEFGKCFPVLSTPDMQLGLKYVIEKFKKKIWKIIDRLVPQPELADFKEAI